MEPKNCLKALSILALSLAPALAQEEPASRVYTAASKSVFLIIVKSANGDAVAQATGFSVEGNRIITNEHVVRGGNPYLDLGAVRVALKIVIVDSVNDLAILMPDAEISSPPLKLSSTQPKPGTTIFALGNPAGLEKSISSGVVAGVRNLSGRELLQISAPISPGSSGGPILTANGEVVGVAVGMLEAGQNLNFAVPATILHRLLNGENVTNDIPSLLSRASDLSIKRWSETKYSADADSPFQRLGAEIDDLLSRCIGLANSDASSLTEIAEKAFEAGSPIAVAASEQAVAAKPIPAAYLILAKSLKAQAPIGDSESPILKRAEAAIRSCFKSARQPTIEMYLLFADIVEDRFLPTEARLAYTKAYDMAKAHGNSAPIVDALRGLVRTSSSLNDKVESDRWFKLLVESGSVTFFDWQEYAYRKYQQGEFRLSGDTYVKAAQGPMFWTNWCRAAIAYSSVKGAEDEVLQTARTCITNGAGNKDSDNLLAMAHDEIATVLNQRGVYEEALSHAREAASLAPESAFYEYTLAESFRGLRRFQEAINASKQAIRLSDGKFSAMHFSLGAAYFDIENWQAARQSFEKAAELDPKDDAAAYNVALCLVRLAFYLDAANWYEEVLRRNPNHAKKQDILNSIRALRQ